MDTNTATYSYIHTYTHTCTCIQVHGFGYVLLHSQYSGGQPANASLSHHQQQLENIGLGVCAAIFMRDNFSLKPALWGPFGPSSQLQKAVLGFGCVMTMLEMTVVKISSKTRPLDGSLRGEVTTIRDKDLKPTLDESNWWSSSGSIFLVLFSSNSRSLTSLCSSGLFILINV